MCDFLKAEREGWRRKREEGGAEKTKAQAWITVISEAVTLQWFKGEVVLNFVQGSPVTSCLPAVWYQQLTRLHHHGALLAISKTHTDLIN